MVNTPGRESGGSWFETYLGVWYPRRRPCGVAINTLVDLINWLGKPKVLKPWRHIVLVLHRSRGRYRNPVLAAWMPCSPALAAIRDCECIAGSWVHGGQLGDGDARCGWQGAEADVDGLMRC